PEMSILINKAATSALAVRPGAGDDPRIIDSARGCVGSAGIVECCELAIRQHEALSDKVAVEVPADDNSGIIDCGRDRAHCARNLERRVLSAAQAEAEGEAASRCIADDIT